MLPSPSCERTIHEFAKIYHDNGGKICVHFFSCLFTNFVCKQTFFVLFQELMDQMVKKTTLECEDSNRQYVSSLNGLAGLDIIEQNFADAAEKYREVLRVVAEYKGKIKTDTLQKLHSVSNLAELLEAGHENMPLNINLKMHFI